MKFKSCQRVSALRRFASRVAFLAAWMLATGVPVYASETSPLLFDPPFIDFADLYEHETARTNVLVFNGGAEPVAIERLGRTCPDCLTLSMETMILDPGEASTLHVELCPETGPGFLHELITVETASGISPALPVQARIHASYQVEGAPYLMTARSEDDPLGHVVTITSRFDMKGALTSPGDTNSIFSVTVQPDRYPGSFIAEITVKGPIPVGMNSEALQLSSTDPSDPPCWVDLAVFLPPPVHVYPARLLVAPVNREQLRILFIEQRLETPAQILEVRVPDPSVTWEYNPGYSLEQSRVNVYVRGMGGKNGLIGDLVLVTDQADQPEIRIPLVVDDRMPTGPVAGNWEVPVANRRGCGCGSKM